MCSCCCNSGSLIRLLKGKNEFALNCFTKFVNWYCCAYFTVEEIGPEMPGSQWSNWEWAYWF